MPPITETPATAEATVEDVTPAAEEQVVAEELVEEVSIDGMCGVY